MAEIAEAEAKLAGTICGLAIVRDTMSTHDFAEKVLDAVETLVEARFNELFPPIYDFTKGGIYGHDRTS